MATLEKIRKRSVLLFIVIIGALLAFILGDFLTSGRSFTGPGDTVAKANGTKVDYRAFQQRASELSDQMKNDPRYAQQQIDQSMLDAQVINELLLEKLLDQEYDELGIKVTDSQISRLFFDPAYASSTFQMLMSQFGQQGAQALYQTGIVDTRAYADAMKSPAKYKLTAEDGKMLTGVWNKMEGDADKQLRQQAYVSLLSGLFTANKVDAKALYDDRNTTSTFAYVRKDFTTIPDKDIKITDEDYQKVYDEHKGAYKIDEETRVVKYVVVNIEPSAADYEAGAAEAAGLRTDLLANEGISAALKNHKGFKSTTGKYTRGKIMDDNSLRVLAGTDSTSAGLAVGTVKDLPSRPGVHSMAKITGVSTGIDNVKFSAVSVPASADSLINNLTAATFDSIAAPLGGQKDIEISLASPVQTLPAEISAALETNAVGTVFFLTDTVSQQTEKGIEKQVYKSAYLIKERSLPENIYDVAQMEYVVVPSEKTMSDLNSKLHAFVANHSTAESFAKNAKKNGYTVLDAVVTPSTPSLGGAPGTRSTVKWAMKADKGAVSPVFNHSNNNFLMAVAVEDVFDGDYLPVTSAFVREQLKPVILADKKAEKLIKQYAGKAKDLNGYASAMGEAVANAESVFGDNSIPAIGFNEFTLQGQVAAAKKGAVAGPFKGNNAVYVISVNDVKTSGRPYNFKEDAVNFNQIVGQSVMGNPLRLLVGKGTIENNILEFTGDEE